MLCPGIGVRVLFSISFGVVFVVGSAGVPESVRAAGHVDVSVCELLGALLLLSCGAVPWHYRGDERDPIEDPSSPYGRLPPPRPGPPPRGGKKNLNYMCGLYSLWSADCESRTVVIFSRWCGLWAVWDFGVAVGFRRLGVLGLGAPAGLVEIWGSIVSRIRLWSGGREVGARPDLCEISGLT